MRDINTSSYEKDDRTYLTEFLEYLDIKKKDKKKEKSCNNESTHKHSSFSYKYI